MTVFPIAKTAVTEHEILNVLGLREARETLRRRLGAVELSLLSYEAALIQKLQNQADTTRCGHIVTLRNGALIISE